MDSGPGPQGLPVDSGHLMKTWRFPDPPEIGCPLSPPDFNPRVPLPGYSAMPADRHDEPTLVMPTPPAGSPPHPRRPPARVFSCAAIMSEARLNYGEVLCSRAGYR
jgi:hypothetical protein